MKGDSCTDENQHWFPPFYENWSDSTQGSFLTKWEGLGDKVAANLRRMELANILSEWIQKSSRGNTPPEPPPPHPPLEACNFGACLRNTSAFILYLLQHITPHILEGFSSHNPQIMCIWGNCGKEVLHFVTQSNNVVLNKQGFW